MSRRVLVVDGVASDRERGQKALSAAGYEVEGVSDGADGFELMMASCYDVVVVNCCLDRLDAPALVSKLRAHGVKTPVLVWSTTEDPARLEATMKLTGGPFVDKTGAIDALVKNVGAVLSGGAPAAAIPCPRLKDEPSGGGVLMIDERDRDIEALRAMLPPTLYFEGCATVTDGLARAHDHKFDLALFDNDGAVTNLTGILAQFHLLLPNGFVVGVANVAYGESPERILKLLRGYDFDDLTFKPFKNETIDKLLARYCSRWEDLVVVVDDVVEASPRRARSEQYKTFACNLKTRLEEGIRSLSDACFDRAIVDVSAVDSVTTMDMAEILRRLTNYAKPLGLSVRFATAPAMLTAIRKWEGSFGWDALPLFPSVADARTG